MIFQNYLIRIVYLTTIKPAKSGTLYHFFFLPQIDDPTKDKFYEISGYSAVNQSGEIDVACAHTSKK